MKKVFTNGVFDLFHIGHYNLLKKAKEYGDFLVVGVASDESCQKYKRVPIMSWEERANSIRKLSFVDEVIKTSWSVDLEKKFYTDNKFDVQVQGDSSSSFNLAKRLGILKVAGRTEGISTTKLLEIIDIKQYEILNGGYLNDVRKVNFENNTYILKYGFRNVAKKYPIQLPSNRIRDEFDVIMAFREKVTNPTFIVNPLSTNFKDLIVFESAPDTSESLFDRLIRDNKPNTDLLVNIIMDLSLMHNVTFNDEKLRNLFKDNAAFHQIKIDVQCLNVSRISDINDIIRDFITDSMNIQKVLLHGDFAPKNILVWSNKYLFIDFEESGYADPALDVGYFLAHLLLHKIMSEEKSWEGVIEKLLVIYLNNFKGAADDRGLINRIYVYIGIFLLSRINSKAPAEYVSMHLHDKINAIGEKYIKAYSKHPKI